jgi:YfiH family protein
MWNKQPAKQILDGHPWALFFTHNLYERLSSGYAHDFEDAPMGWVGKNGLLLWQFEVLTGAGASAHAVTGRKTQDDEEFNMSVASEAAWDNRKKLCETLGLELEKLAVCYQVHSDTVAVVRGDESGGNKKCLAVFPDTDGLVTATKGIGLLTTAADCTLVLLYDPVKQVVGNLHSGWRGTASNIVEKCMRTMAEHFGSEPKNLVAGISPAARRCCYQIGEDVARAFSHWREHVFPDPENEGKFFCDVPGIVKRQLIACEVSPENIEDCGICTICRNDLFYSYRRAGSLDGAHAAIIGLSATSSE